MEQQPLIEKGWFERIGNHCFAYILSIFLICFFGGIILTLIGASTESNKLLYLGSVIMLISFGALPCCMVYFHRLEKKHLENNV